MARASRYIADNFEYEVPQHDPETIKEYGIDFGSRFMPPTAPEAYPHPTFPEKYTTPEDAPTTAKDVNGPEIVRHKDGSAITVPSGTGAHLGKPNSTQAQVRVEHSIGSTWLSPDFIRELEKSMEMTFVDKLFFYMDQKGLRDSQVYKAAQIDRRLFSKIRSNRNYTPEKDNCVALCFALNLTLEETTDLLERAGYTLSHSKKRDIVLEFLIREQVYNLIAVDQVLDRLGLKPLRS